MQNTFTPPPQLITFAELKTRHPESAWVRLVGDTWIGEMLAKKQSIIGYIAQDAVLESDLNLDLPCSYELLFVAGNLTVGGVLRNNNASAGLHLAVTGNLAAGAVIAGGSHIHIDGDADITHLIYGHGNDGALQIHGRTRVPLVIYDDHDIGVNGEPNTVQVECFCGQDDEDVFTPEVKNEEGEINIEMILAWLQAGHNPLRAGNDDDHDE